MPNARRTQRSHRAKPKSNSNHRTAKQPNRRASKLNALLADGKVYDVDSTAPQLPKSRTFYTDKSVRTVLSDITAAQQHQQQYSSKKATLKSDRRNSKFDIRSSKRSGDALFEYKVLQNITQYFVSAGYMNCDKRTDAVQTLTVVQHDTIPTQQYARASTAQQRTQQSAAASTAAYNNIECNTLERPVKPLHTHKPVQQQPTKPLTAKQRRAAKRNANNDRDAADARRDVQNALRSHINNSHAAEQQLTDSSDDDAYYTRNNATIDQYVRRAEHKRDSDYINNIAAQILADDDCDVAENEDAMLERSIQASLMDYKSANQWQQIDDGSADETEQKADGNDSDVEIVDAPGEPLFIIDTTGTLHTDTAEPVDSMNAIETSTNELHIDSSTASADESTDYSNSQQHSSHDSSDADLHDSAHTTDTENEADLYDNDAVDDDVAVLYSTYSPLTSYTQHVPTEYIDAFPIDLARTAPAAEVFGAAQWLMHGRVARDDTVQSDDSNIDSDDEDDEDDSEFIEDESEHSDDELLADFNDEADIDDFKLSQRHIAYPAAGKTTKLHKRSKHAQYGSESDEDQLFGNIDQCTCPQHTLFDIAALNQRIHAHFIANKSKQNLVLEPNSNRFHRMQCHSLAELYNLQSYSTDCTDSSERYTTLKHTPHTATPAHKILQLFLHQCKVKNSKLLKSQAKQYGCLVHSHLNIKAVKKGVKGGGMSVGKLMSKLNKKMNKDRHGKRVTGTMRQSDKQSRGRKSAGGGGRRDESDTHAMQQARSKAAKPIDDNNVGNRMLRLLGWSDGVGLGKQSNQGIVIPILPTLKFNKRGIGAA